VCVCVCVCVCLRVCVCVCVHTYSEQQCNTKEDLKHQLLVSNRKDEEKCGLCLGGGGEVEHTCVWVVVSVLRVCVCVCVCVCVFSQLQLHGSEQT